MDRQHDGCLVVGVVRQRRVRVSVYELRVKGRLDQHWAMWFEGLTLTYEGDNTVLRGLLVDESALHGVLTKVGNLNLRLLSVSVVGTGGAASAIPEPATLDAPPSAPVADPPAQTRKRTARPRRKLLP